VGTSSLLKCIPDDRWIKKKIKLATVDVMQDIFLVNQVIQGNKNAFKLLILRYQRPIFSFLGNFHFPNQIIEDLAQETFLRVYRNISSFDPQRGASFATWLFTISKNLALNMQAKSSYRKEMPMETMKTKVNGPLKSLADKLEQKNVKETVRSAVNKLPLPFKTAVVLSYLDELSLEEIAGIEECPVGTIKSRIFRGKKMLRQILQSGGAL
jgi:RNA polymerase sigma-70 factor (ECF subfamily)